MRLGATPAPAPCRRTTTRRTRHGCRNGGYPVELNEGFADLGLSEPLLAAVAGAGYEAPTPIQQKAIPLVLRGVDLLGCAQTGTGKTASYALPIIDILSSGTGKPRMPRCLILAPTRELAQQIADNFVTYGANHSLRQALLIGGEGFTLQEAALGKDPDILIATPGRLIDMFERGRIMLGGVKVLVIDEADRMLDMGFIPDVERIVQTLPRIRQTLMFLRHPRARDQEARQGVPDQPQGGERRAAGHGSRHREPRDDPGGAGREAHRAARPAPRRGGAERAHLLQPQEGRRCRLRLTATPRPGRPRAARRHGAVPAHRDAGGVQGGRDQLARLQRRGRSRASTSRRSPTSSTSTCRTIRRTTSHRIGRTGRAGREGRAITLATHEEAEAVDAIAALVNSAIPLTTPEGEPAALDAAPRARPRRGRRRREESGTAEKRPTRQRKRSTEPGTESKPQRKRSAEPDAESKPQRKRARNGGRRRGPPRAQARQAERPCPRG